MCVWCGFILRMSGAFRRMLRAIITVVRHKMRYSDPAFMQLSKSFCLNIFPCKRWNPTFRKLLSHSFCSNHYVGTRQSFAESTRPYRKWTYIHRYMIFHSSQMRLLSLSLELELFVWYARNYEVVTKRWGCFFGNKVPNVCCRASDKIINHYE